MSSLQVCDITKRFGALKAVDRVSFQVGPGEICGFIGPNGAGKTTTMRICSTLELPDHGDVLVAPGDRPYVIDFSTASFAGRHGSRARRFFFDQARLNDLRAVAKLRRRWLGAAAADVPERPVLYRVGSSLRRLLGL